VTVRLSLVFTGAARKISHELGKGPLHNGFQKYHKKWQLYLPNSSPKWIGYSILPRSCSLQRASRLRRTYLFNKLHSPTSVPSTPNAHFKNRMSSRLHQMLVFLKKCCLAYTKHLLWEVLWEAEPSLAEPSRAGPPGGDRGWLIARSRKTKSLKKRTSRLHQTPIFLASIFWAVINAWDIQFCLATAPSNERLANIEHTFSTNCTLQRASRLHQMHISKIKCHLVWTKC
jgi:hypothetical protein